MGKRRARRSMRAMMMAAAAASVSAIATSAGAATKTWADGNGQLIPVFWSTASDWSPTGVPATGDDVIVSGKVGGITLGGLNLTYDYTNGGGVTLNSLTLGQSGGAGTLVMSSAVTLVSLNEYLGNSGAGGSNGIGVITQTAGLNSVGSNGGVNTLYMGYNATDRGFYSLGGTGSLSCSGPLYVGYNGQGTFTQSGGSASLSFASPLDLGANLGSQGVYNLSGGTFTPSAGEFIGIAGTGTFNQTGGANNAVGGVTIATNNFGACAYTLTSGALNITNGGFSVADNGAGSMNQSGGSVSVSSAGSLYVGHSSQAVGSYTLSGTGSLSIASTAFVGYGGSGTFIQSGNSTVTTAGSVGLAWLANSSGTYSLAGSASLSVGGSIFVGDTGNGLFNQSGGSGNVAGAVFVGGTSGTGTYSLSGGSLSAENTAVFQGSTFNHSGGTAVYSSVGQQVEIDGTYNLSGTGSLQVSGQPEIINGGTFNQTGGTHSLTSASGVSITGLSGRTGTYTFSGGDAYLASVFVGGTSSGGSGPGVLNISGPPQGAEMFIGGPLVVYDVPGAAVNLSGGTLIAGSYNLNGNPSRLHWTGGQLYISSDITFDPAANPTTTSAAFGSSLTLGPTQTMVVSGNQTLGGGGAFSLTVNGGTDYLSNVGAVLTVPSKGTLTINPGSFLRYDTLVQSGGTINGTLTNSTSFTYQSGLFNGRLVNRGTLNLGNAFTAGNGIESDTNLTLAPGQYVAFNGQGLNNQATMTLNGPTLDGNGPITNAAGQLMSGYASVFGSGGFINLGQFTQSGGNLAIWNTGPNSNGGQMDLQAPNQLQLGMATATLTNSGTLNLNGATVSGAGQITNAAAGVISGHGTILTGLNNGGTITLSDGQLNTPSFANTGSITPAGPSAVISGGNIVNQGTIDGSGKVNNNVVNTGTIEPIGGTLILTGAVSNNAGGLVTATAGNKLLLTQGLGINGGLISLTGGTIDTNHTSLTNSGTISGYGVLRTGGLTNASQITLTGGTTTIDGPVTNNSGARIDVRYSSAVFNSPVINNAGAIFKTTAASVSFVAPFINNGIYNSDPATNTFTDLTVGADGALVGGEGDRFIVTGNFSNGSTLSATWDTAAATLELAGGVNHTLAPASRDRGADYSGLVNNFGWGTIQLDASDSLTLAPGGALYAEVFSLEGGLSQLDAITGNGSNIYYDPAQPANAYLSDRSYSLAGGGVLAPVPEPWSVGLVGLSALMLTRSRRR